MDKTILVLILVTLCSIMVSGSVRVEYSEDNITWTNVSDVDLINKEARLNYLNVGETYYFRAKNATTSFGYVVSRTLGSIETSRFWFFMSMMVLSIIFMVIYKLTQGSMYPTFVGMILIFFALDFTNNPLPNLETQLLKTSFNIILLGLGFILILVPNLPYIEGAKDD